MLSSVVTFSSSKCEAFNEHYVTMPTLSKGRITTGIESYLGRIPVIGGLRIINNGNWESESVQTIMI